MAIKIMLNCFNNMEEIHVIILSEEKQHNYAV